MKKFYFILFVFCFNFLSAQINTGILPQSFEHNLSLQEVDHINLYPPNMELIRSEDAIDEKNGEMMKVARLIPFNANIDNSGTWDITSDGKNIWRLRVSSEGAKSCVLHFDEFELPKGSELFVYNPDKSVVLGPYTSADNDDGGSYAIGIVFGQELIIEYLAPLTKSLDGQVEIVKPKIEMSAFSYFYRGEALYDNRASANFGSSGSCMVNANCSEGNNWRTQQKGVARIYVVEGYYGGYCSGTLINNTNNDQTPYFLTADHCGGSASAYEFGQWIFRFKYESPSCNAISEPSGVNVTGCTRKARGPLNGGSDFLLLQLNTSSANLKNIGAVYNGWSTSTTGSPSGISFHHPSGDIKKISTYTQTLTSITYYGQGETGANYAHWKVLWANTANGHGVTEGGSSGSPLFNNNGLVVGTLSGGSSYCESPNSPDLYGKFSYHWTSNGSTNDKQLKPWLAPNSSATSCDFLDPNNIGLVCNFSGTPTTVTAGNTVNFTDLSTGGTITSRSWSFPGGSPSSSTVASPTITYNNPGTYNVSLTVTSSLGTATETKNGYITVVQSGGSGGFTYDFEACTNFAVDQFSPCTTYDGDGSQTYGSQDVDFENSGYTGAFIAFNPSQTNPPATAENWQAHGGNKYGACFAAYGSANNDWFITPKITLQSNSSFSFWARTLKDQYGKERFNVLISTTNNNISSFTKISTGTYTEAPTTWTKYTYDLNAYNGQGVYLAIQCVSNDAFVFMIDDIEILTSSGGTQNLVADFSGNPTSVQAGGTVNFTDLSTGGTITSRSWSFPGGSPSSSTSSSPTITYNTPGTYNVSLTVYSGQQNATETKQGYITVSQAQSGSGFTYDFEACTNFAVDQFSPCTTYDGDNKSTYSIQDYSFPNQNYTGAFIAFNPSQTTPALGENWQAHGGNKYGACFVANGSANNDWFITPKITLQSNSSFSFWAKSVNDQYGKERFNVLISTTNNNISSFTKISTGTYTEAPTTWTKYTYDLNAYNGQGVYLAIQCVSNDVFVFMIDDIEILTSESTINAPVANFTSNITSGCAPLTVSFWDQSTNNPTSRLWNFTGGSPNSSTSQNPTILYNSPGIYSVSLTATNSAGSNTKTRTNYISVEDCSPVNDNLSSKISVYPNPTNGLINIEIPENTATVKISDILGKVVKTEKLSSNQVSIDLSFLNSGMYFIEIQLSETKYVSKLTLR